MRPCRGKSPNDTAYHVNNLPAGTNANVVAYIIITVILNAFLKSILKNGRKALNQWELIGIQRDVLLRWK